MMRDGVEVHELTKKEQDQYLGILIEQAWPTKDLLFGFQGIFSRDRVGSPQRARELHLARSGSQSQRAIWFIFPTHGASYITLHY